MHGSLQQFYIQIMSVMRNLQSTKECYDELCKIIPAGVNSPVRAFKAVGGTPLIAASANGAEVTDIEGNTYIDYCMSWGAIIHGHAHPEVLNEIQKQLVKGTTYGIATAIEGKLAKKVIDLMPSIEMIRFVSSGTEATMSAIRLARGFTEREIVVKFEGNYHGHADFLLVKAGSGVMNLNESSSKGIPKAIVQHTICLPFNDVAAVKELFRSHLSENIACVIVEPIAGNMGVVKGTVEFLKTLREETEKVGALLIFDEVMTGFRIGKGGAQELYQIKPDLTCLAKIVGGGLPAAAFGGRREIMQCLAPLGGVYQAGTLSGNPLAMVAGLKTLEMLDQSQFFEKLSNKVERFLQPIRNYIREKNIPVCVQSCGSMLTLFCGKKEVHNMNDAKACDSAMFARFFHYLFKRGIYIPPFQQEPWFISVAHSEAQLLKTQAVVIEFFEAEGYV